MRNVKAGRLHFTTSLESCLDKVDIVFSAVGTPPDEDGSADLRYVLEAVSYTHLYPEPEPYSLEKVLAKRFHLSSEEVCVTNGATESIYLRAQTFRNQISAILMPTFSEYADACRLHGHNCLLYTSSDQGVIVQFINISSYYSYNQ